MKKLPLSKAQQMIWLGQQLSPQSSQYNTIFTFNFHEKLDEEQFNVAFHKLVEQCDILRTIILEDEGVAYQSVVEDAKVHHSSLNVTNWSDEQLNDFYSDKNKQVFDLSMACYESVLLEQENTSIWYFNIHHILSDAWSISILYEQLGKLYFNVEPSQFPQFSSFLSENTTEIGQQINQYWSSKENFSALELYGHGFSKTKGNVDRLHISLGQERSKAINNLLSQKEFSSFSKQLSAFTFFASVSFSLLHRISGESNINIGCPVLNRPSPLSKATPGLFIEFFPLSIQLNEQEDFSSLFQKTKFSVFEFLKHAVPNATNSNLTKSFNVVLNYINTAFPEFGHLSSTSKWISSGEIDENHHLRIQIHNFDQTGTFHLCLDLNTDVFSPTKQQLFKDHLFNTIDAFLQDSNQTITEYPILSNQEQDVISSIRSANTKEQESVLSQLQQQVAKQPHAIALKDGDHHLSYKELWAQALQVKEYIRSNHIEPGSTIVLHLERSTAFFKCLVGTMMAGCVFVPLPINLPGKRKEYIIEQSETKLIFSHESLNQYQHWKNPDELGPSSTGNEIIESDIAYILYTSGSTGQPKGVEISHNALSNYINWAQSYYIQGSVNAPLFTSIGFDLTITSIFLPLVTGGTCHIYPEKDTDAATIIDVLKNRELNLVKATPTHLEIAKNEIRNNPNLEVLIVGGEDFKTSLAKIYQTEFGPGLRIINEYGPTEATVGCVIHQFDIEQDIDPSVPIGRSINNMEFMISNNDKTWVPFGVSGELLLNGQSLANGYFLQEELTDTSFITIDGVRYYKTGDIVRLRIDGVLEYLGRKDNQVKILGHRIELAEIEQAIQDVTGSNHTIALQWSKDNVNDHSDLTYCTKCGLPSNYPNAVYNDEGLCNLCENFDSYQRKVKSYFKNEQDLYSLLTSKRTPNRDYDCIQLLSGGKDSSFALAKLVEMNVKVLAYTFDNGYISQEALDNAANICEKLGVELIVGSTPAMNEIFVDSLQRHSNVCNGCFKTIYTLATHLALEKDIPFIVTGLSRGQFFETRLSEELFSSSETSIENIDTIILNARKEYHRIPDAVSEHLDVSIFEDEKVFDDVQFVDFYRFCDAELHEMLTYLDQQLGWKRPTDTGRSTNCLINQLGIFVHKKKEGYSNYAFPYSWDVRIGHKTRDASIDEINEEINEEEVRQMMREIGFDYETEIERQSLITYYEGENIDQEAIKKALRTRLPEYMIPHQVIALPTMPISENGKIDVQHLPNPNQFKYGNSKEQIAPRDEIEEVVYDIWKLVLAIDNFSITDSFISLGGSSLSAIRMTTRVKDLIQLDVPLRVVFEHPTVERYSAYITALIQEKLKEHNA